MGISVAEFRRQTIATLADIKQHSRDIQGWAALENDILRLRYIDLMQPIAEEKIAVLRTKIEDLIDKYGTPYSDPLFAVVEFAEHIPWGNKCHMFVLGWSVISPGLPRVTEIHFPKLKERIRFDDRGFTHYCDSGLYNNGNLVPEQARTMNIYDVYPAQTLLARLHQFFTTR